MKETWKQILGYKELYEISSLGRIRRNNILKPFKSNKGYLIVSLSKNGKVVKHLIHRLVLKTFSTNKFLKKEINHRDFDKTNNNINNLEYVTSKENKYHSRNFMPRGEKQGLSKLKESDVIKIRHLFKNKMGNTYSLAKKFNVSNVTIGNIVNRYTWRHI